MTRPGDSPDVVIMAGGFGRRLGQRTTDTPKPMLPVGGRPLLKIILEQLRDQGLNRICIAAHYRAEVIQRELGDGAELGIRLGYILEQEPLGTAGALAKLSAWPERLLVINGDTLARLDYRQMLKRHEQRHAALTIATWRFALPVPFGVVDVREDRVLGLVEKPAISVLINAGIYVLSPCARDFVPSNVSFSMPELITGLIAAELIVCAYPVEGYWRDLGDASSYEQAQEDAKRFGF